MRRVTVLSFAAGLALASSALAHPPGMGRPGSGHLPAGPDAFPFSDNFDSYSPGVFPCTGGGCTGPNGWSVWYSGGAPGNIVSGGAHSGANSFSMDPTTDVVQTGNVTSGQWTISAQTFFPTAATGDGYFILLHGYGDAALDSWSVVIRFDGDDGQLYDEINGTFPYGPAVSIGSVIRGQWVPIRAEINLTANTYDFYYNNVQLIDDRVYSPPGTPVATPGIQCIDLYSFSSSGMRYDTISMTSAGGGCYGNCDNSTTPPVLNVADFTCFLQRYAAGDTYANCDNSTTPPTLNVADFTCFLQRYAAGCP
jgi:hypothetical protein